MKDTLIKGGPTARQARRAKIREQKERKAIAADTFRQTAKDATVLELSAQVRRWMIFSLWSIMAIMILVILVVVLAVKAAQCQAC